jgi:hypothetical protein
LDTWYQLQSIVQKAKLFSGLNTHYGQYAKYIGGLSHHSVGSHNFSLPRTIIPDARVLTKETLNELNNEYQK